MQAEVPNEGQSPHVAQAHSLLVDLAQERIRAVMPTIHDQIAALQVQQCSQAMSLHDMTISSLCAAAREEVARSISPVNDLMHQDNLADTDPEESLPPVPEFKGRAWDFECQIQCKNGNFVKAALLGDTGASKSAFVDENFVRRHKLPTVDLARPCNLKLADGRLVEQVTKAAQVTIRIGNHVDTGWAIVTHLKTYDIIHGMPWFEQHQPTPNWSDRSLTLQLEYCLKNCIHDHQPVLMCSPYGNSPTQPSFDIYAVKARTFMKIANRKDHKVMVFWPKDFEPEVAAISP